MDIIEKFGNVVGNEALKDPDKARRLLLAGYRLQEKKLQLFPDRELPLSGQYAARGHEKYHSGTCKTAKFGNDEHFRSGRTSNGGGTDTVFCGSAVLFYSRYKM